MTQTSFRIRYENPRLCVPQLDIFEAPSSAVPRWAKSAGPAAVRGTPKPSPKVQRLWHNRRLTPALPILLIIAAVTLTMLVGMVFVLARSLRDVPSGSALVIRSPSAPPKVCFGRTMVIPLVQTAELLDISQKRVLVERRGSTALRCRDNAQVDMRVELIVSVNPTTEDILRVRDRISAASLASASFMQQLFETRFAAALETVAGTIDARVFELEREAVVNEIIKILEPTLDGFRLDSVALTDVHIRPPAQPD